MSSSKGDDANDGSQDKPKMTLGAALAAAAAGKPVYACAETFTEPLVVATKVDLYGGLDCANGWAYVVATTKTTLMAAPDAIPLKLASSASGSLVADFHVEAAEAATPGGSSIALLADGAEAELLRSELVAGAGAPGANGTTPMGVGPNGESTNGLDGSKGTAGCAGGMGVIGGGGQLVCQGTDVAGGPGAALLGHGSWRPAAARTSPRKAFAAVNSAIPL